MVGVTCTDSEGNIVEHLTQWDVNQSITIHYSGTITSPVFHFSNQNSSEALVVDDVTVDGDTSSGYDLTVEVPNILLQEPYAIMVYLYDYSGTVGGSEVPAKVKAAVRIAVKRRVEPANQTYADTIDGAFFDDTNEKIDELEETLNELKDEASGLNNITTEKLVDGAVTTAKIANSNVTAAKIANSAVTSAKIADSNVITSKIADGSVTKAKLADESVNASKIETGAVTTSAIEDGAITNAKLAINAVEANNLADECVSTEALQVQSVQEYNIADGSVSVDKLSSELSTYSTTPQKIGYWTNGTPIWRMVVTHSFDAEEITDIGDDNCITPEALPVTDYSTVFVINAWISLMSDEPCQIDDVHCTWESTSTVTFPDECLTVIKQGITTGYYGWIEFVTAENNIKTA